MIKLHQRLWVVTGTLFSLSVSAEWKPAAAQTNRAAVAATAPQLNRNYTYRGPASDTLRSSAAGPDGEPIDGVSWWSAENQRYSIGYENGTGNFNLFGRNAVSVSAVIAPRLIGDLYFGYTKNADTTSIQIVTTDTGLTGVRTTTTTYGGVASPHVVTLGGGFRSILYQSSWVQIHAGAVAAIVFPFAAKYNTGALAETFPNKDDASNKTVVDTVTSNVSKESISLQMGPRIGSEFYLKWIPHLALGFSTGIITTFGGSTLTTTTARAKNYSVVNGVEQAPTADNTTVTTLETKPGMRGTTFGIGGTVFNLFGNFSLRYVW